MVNIYILIFYILFLYIGIVKSKVSLNAVAFSKNGGSDIYVPIIKQFNEYARNNTLDIEVKIELLTDSNSTNSVKDYEGTLEYFLRRGSKKYDLLFYDNIYTTRFGPYLLDLKTYLPEEHLNLYKPGIASKSCIYGDDKWVGHPVTIDFAVLYTNRDYMKTYNKTIPTTWNELLETAKYIMDEEKRLYNNTDLMGYNGLFSDKESGTCSLNEFIYSFRNSVNDDYPDLQSKEAIDALNMIKRIKEEISSTEEFLKDEEYAFGKIMDAKFIFLKFWYLPNMDLYYGTSILPGVKEGISGSCLGGYNIGINGHISDTKKSAAAKALMYMTSKEIQKQITINNKLYVAIPSIYEDEEVCNAIDCEFFKSIQLTSREKVSNYNKYSDNYRKKLFDFLYGDTTAENALSNVRDITKIYYISLDTKETAVGLVVFILCIILSVVMISLLLFLKSEKYKSYFAFLPIDFWIILIFGSIFILYSCLLDIGKLSSFKCHLKPLFFSLGFTLVLTPVLYRLIVNFNNPNKLTEWIDNHRYYFILIFISIDILLFLMTFISPFTIKDKIIKDGKNFQICDMKSGLNHAIIIIIEIYKFLVALTILFFIFLEWSIEKTYYDVRYIVIAIYLDIVSASSLFIINYLNIDHYILRFILLSTIIIFFSIGNFTFIYGFRIVFSLMKNNNEEDLFIKKFRDEVAKNNNSTNPSNSIKIGSNSSIHSSSTSNIKAKILNYHYQKSSFDNGSKGSIRSGESISKSNSGDLY